MVADNAWIFGTDIESDRILGYRFIPSVRLEGVFYPGYRNSIFNQGGTRLDLLGSIGKDADRLAYTLKFAFETSIPIGEKDSLRVDMSAFSLRRNVQMRDSYEEYGGWDGMPGVGNRVMVPDFFMAGLGYQHMISSGIANSYIVLQARAGLRARRFFDLLDAFLDWESMTPFSLCLDGGKWDFGFGAGYGISSPVGDVILGIGMNLDLETAVYIEIR